MSAQDIQNLYKIINDLREKVSTHIGQSSAEHKNFERHIKKDDDWKEKMETQLNAIATALLQDQTRDGVEKEAEQKAEKKEETLDNKKILIYLTILAGVFAIFSNIGEVIKFLAKLFSLLAG